MKPIQLSILALGVAALAACNGDKTANGSAPATDLASKAVPAPANGDWSETVALSPEGGYVMGNPNAKVKLVEYGSLTCPHCREFDEKGAPSLIGNYVKKGLVSWEFRNFVRDPYDITASLVARCGGPSSVFGLTRAFYADQPNWIGKIQAADQATMQSLQNMNPQQQFAKIAELGGLAEFAALRGVPKAKTAACLADQAEASKLVQMNSDAVAQFPQFPGTPTFLVNGKIVDNVATWELLEPKLKEALGG
ncbi:MAG: thioredoxin domain-containing protein [Sphingomicrobium sp.]